MKRVGQTAAVVLGMLSSAGVRAETYEDAWRSAQTGPQPAIARARYLAATARSAIAVADARPRITFDAYASRDFDTGGYGPRLRNQSTAQLIVPLYQGGSSRAAIAAARADEHAQHEQVLVSDLKLAVDVADAYAGVREARALGVVADEAVERLTLFAHRIDAEQRAGTVSLTDMADCRVRLAAARRDRVDARRQEDAAAARFEMTVGRPPGATLAPLSLPPPATVDIAASVRAGSPELRGLHHTIEAARYRVAEQRGMGRPTLTFVASASYGNTGMGMVDPSIVSLPGGALFVVASPRRFPQQFGGRGLLVLTVPLSRGGDVAARTARARAAEREAEATAEVREAAIIAAARRSLARARAALVQQDLADAAVADSREALRGIDAARSVGDRSEHDVLVASTELAAAGRQRAHAEREAAVQAVTALAAIGQLPDTHHAASSPATAARPADKLGFDLAGLAGSHVTRAAGPAPRPLAYDLRGLG